MGRVKPGDITVQQYHRGFATSAFDVTIAHPLQKKFIQIAMEEAGMAAEEAHDKMVIKCAKRKAFTLCPWPGSQQQEQLRLCTRLFASGLSWKVLVEAILRI